MPRADFRDRLLECLGGPWPEACPLNVQVRDETSHEGYRIRSVLFDALPGDAVPALILIPDGATAASTAPAVCVWHQHNGEWHLGKSEPAGLAGNLMHHTGAALAKLGYVVVCPDTLCFEERQDPTGKLKNGDFERFEFLRYTLQGTCLAWRNILDMRRTVDLAESLPEVRAGRIGCYGHSMGSTNAWMVGPWEPRLACVVGNCCLPTWKAIHDAHLLHCFANFIPGAWAHGDTPDIASLIAPRPLLLNFGETDGGSPIDEVRRGAETIGNAYAAMHAEDKFDAFIEPDTGHVLSAAMWQRTQDWFHRHLKDA